ncbi:MAG: hypothetical protein AAGC60_13455 [Acidobacteriota bacterium]
MPIRNVSPALIATSLFALLLTPAAWTAASSADELSAPWEHESAFTSLATSATISKSLSSASIATPQSVSCGIGAECSSTISGVYECQAWVSPAGSYNYWWIWRGPGQLYQTNDPYVTITDCYSGIGWLTVDALDHSTGASCRTTFIVDCDDRDGDYPDDF